VVRLLSVEKAVSRKTSNLRAPEDLKMTMASPPFFLAEKESPEFLSSLSEVLTRNPDRRVFASEIA
jgi:hypothetical protein